MYWMGLPLLCEKSEAIFIVLVGLTGGQQSDEIVVNLNNFKFSTDCILRVYKVFYKGTVLLCVTNVFQSVLSGKVYCEVRMLCRHVKVGCHVFHVDPYY